MFEFHWTMEERRKKEESSFLYALNPRTWNKSRIRNLKKEVPPGIEPGPSGLKPDVLTVTPRDLAALTRKDDIWTVMNYLEWKYGLAAVKRKWYHGYCSRQFACLYGWWYSIFNLKQIFVYHNKMLFINLLIIAEIVNVTYKINSIGKIWLEIHI